MNIEKPLVSICSTTYNREKFIGQALDSWLMQKVNFNIEIVISDDCSTDNTVNIIEEYITNYPNIKFKLLKATQNQGFVKNSIKVYESAEGKYIAHCDGDDYWIDEHKLQKQVDFLEKNPDYVMCFTNSYIYNQKTNEKRIAKVNSWDTCTTREILKEHNSLTAEKHGELQTLGHMSSIVFRNFIIISYPKWYYTTYNNDDTLFVMLSKYGKAKMINEVCTIYRINEDGVSNFNFSFKRDYKERIKYYKHLNIYLDFKYKKNINTLLSNYYIKLFNLYWREKKYSAALMSIFAILYFNPKLLNEKLLTKK